MSSKIEGNTIFSDAVVFQNPVTLPADTVTAANIKTAAGIEVTKMDHIHLGKHNQSGTVASASDGCHVALAAGTVNSLKAFMIGANAGAATVTVDLLKNGTTVLSATADFSSSDAARAVKTGTITTAAYVAGDVFEFVITAAAGGGTLGTGLYAQAEFREAVS